ncbi:1,6-anhydro-N-acetylmuramyl-L-alanine amidase AmpD [Halioxenophilus sp. WMMB6]|uniref:1,6-anhydro-N-acetylmuramyl-L-alanine amidase AmpD n=1 Tax=Halioxenophilus sp. WMMB6 TaxID=3073815 RepID=UPI00295ED168|nr:1,6-anhydro-N-acetylmuramyl-L-alanine amidase AmpD [Halioxenophilus sp. WMMB6]
MIDRKGWLQLDAPIRVQHRPSPNFNQRPNGADISLLVIHNISLPPGCYGGGFIEQFFQNRLPKDEHPYFAEIAELQVSAHGLIDRSGGFTQFVGFYDRAWHAGASEYHGRSNCNDFSIGIELEGCDTEPFSVDQYRCLTWLSRVIMECFPAISVERIVGHSDIAPGRKTDPGPCFDWVGYRHSLAR